MGIQSTRKLLVSSDEFDPKTLVHFLTTHMLTNYKTTGVEHKSLLGSSLLLVSFSDYPYLLAA